MPVTCSSYILHILRQWPNFWQKLRHRSPLRKINYGFKGKFVQESTSVGKCA